MKPKKQPNSILPPGAAAKLHPSETILGGPAKYINPMRKRTKPSQKKSKGFLAKIFGV